MIDPYTVATLGIRSRPAQVAALGLLSSEAVAHVVQCARGLVLGVLALTGDVVSDVVQCAASVLVGDVVELAVVLADVTDATGEVLTVHAEAAALLPDVTAFVGVLESC